jgi:hypothetical protein
MVSKQSSMSMNFAIVVLTGILIASTGECVGVAQQRPAETVMSVCDLAHVGAVMAGRRLRIAAIYETDFRHGAVLLDRRCAGSGIGIRYSTAKPRDPGLDDFERAQIPSAEGPKHSRASTFEVEMSGEFVWRPNESRQGLLVRGKGLAVPDNRIP